MRRSARLFVPRALGLSACAGFLLYCQSTPAMIIGTGAPGSGSTSLWTGVGTITNGFDPGVATLIDTTHVLTVAHLVYDTSTSQPFATSQVAFHLNGADYAASKIVVNPSYTGAGPTLTADRYDIAVVTLASPVIGGTTYAYNRAGGLVETAAGTAHLVGYGVGGDGVNGSNATTFPFGTKREAINAIDAVTNAPMLVTDGMGNSDTLPAGLLVWDFDNPTAGTSGPLGGPALGPTEGDGAGGDSGAPIFQFDTASNQFIITGLLTDGTDPNTHFGEIGWGTQVAAYSDFVASAVPEPTALAPLLLGAAALLSRRRRARV